MIASHSTSCNEKVAARIIVNTCISVCNSTVLLGYATNTHLTTTSVTLAMNFSNVFTAVTHIFYAGNLDFQTFSLSYREEWTLRICVMIWRRGGVILHAPMRTIGGIVIWNLAVMGHGRMKRTKGMFSHGFPFRMQGN